MTYKQFKAAVADKVDDILPELGFLMIVTAVYLQVDGMLAGGEPPRVLALSTLALIFAGIITIGSADVNKLKEKAEGAPNGRHDEGTN